MNTARLGLRLVRSVRSVSSKRALSFPQTSIQQRWATYRSFPKKEGRHGSRGQGQGYSAFGPFARAQYLWRNYQTPFLVVGAAGGTFYVINLETVPISGRRRFNVFSSETEKSMSSQGYQDILKEFRGKILPANHPYTRLVAKVVENLLPSTGGLAGDEWRVHVIDEPDVANAFVMPGGKVFVFTGILPLCQDENGLAAVLGHEIAHNIAHHAAERLSRTIPITLATMFGSLLFDVSGQLSGSLASLILELPNSRTQENEADRIGLMIMAESCYDPNNVPDLWKRMAQGQKNDPPQFLSTHPASSARAETIRAWLPEANAKLEASQCAQTSKYADQFRQIFRQQQVSIF